MAIAKRIILFLVVNILVVTAISFILYILGIQPYLQQHQLNLVSLAVFCLIWGMGGAFISLALSRIMAKWLMGVKLIDPNTRDPELRRILDMVYNLCEKAGLPAMPEVGIYQSPEVNAFATGPTKRRALVAISTGLLSRMQEPEIEGVIGHEVTHIANGDMVTMTLLQGIVNAFVMFLSRVIAFAITKLIRRDSEGDSSSFVFHMIVFVLQICFMILGSIVIASFSRYREFRADAGGARLAGRDKMISALNALQRVTGIVDERKQQPSIQALQISGQSAFMRLFSSHPPLEERIARLQKLKLR